MWTLFAAVDGGHGTQQKQMQTIVCAVFDELSNGVNFMKIVLIQCYREVNVPERPRIMTHTSDVRCESENEN
jgi:hypothetical protein